jgi:rubrerythrin
MSLTIKNLESALAGESMAHIKYRYFAKLARAEGFEEVAQHFEHTADQEIKHAWGHLELLIGTPDTRKCLELAIEGETYEFTTMYPEFRRAAEHEGNARAVAEATNQIAESKEHAEQFQKVLALAQKRFAALAAVEKRHAEAYKQKLETL